MNNKYKISVVIPTYNRVKILPSLIKSWKLADKNTKFKYEIIFSDDGSSDSTLSYLSSIKDLPIVILKNRHSGPSGARNAAIKYARGERILFMGDDIYPNKNTLNMHNRAGKEYGENFAILGDVIWHKKLKTNFLMKHITENGNEQFSYSRMHNKQIVDFRHFYTCNLSVSRTFLLSENNFFNKKFNRYGFEDVELGYRLEKKGLKIIFIDKPSSQHHHYYDLPAFIRRQDSAGAMLNVFLNIHPECKSLRPEEFAFKKGNYKVAYQRLNSLIDRSMAIEGYLNKDLAKKHRAIVEQYLSSIYFLIFKVHFLAGFHGYKFGLDSRSLLPQIFYENNYFHREEYWDYIARHKIGEKQTIEIEIRLTEQLLFKKRIKTNLLIALKYLLLTIGVTKNTKTYFLIKQLLNKSKLIK